MLELAGIIILGIIAQWAAWRLKLPAILPLILIGLFVGPISTLLSEDGTKWIEPLWNGEKGLFPGESLYYFVSLAISIILFEGGLTLKRSEIRTIGPVITKLITIGSAVTFFLAGAAAYFIFGLSLKISFLFSALIIVTGPTVISPILRNIPLKKDVSSVLKWEGILIDPIGALVAVLVFEFISVGEGQEYTKTALIEFGKILLFGTTFGFTFAHGLAFAIKKKLIPHYLLNVVSLSVVLLVFVESDIFAHESGLLAVVVMGMVLGNMDLPNLKELLYFKESLSVLLISILFILLSANINIEDLELLYRWETVALFAIVVFIVRPLGVLLSTHGSDLKMNERIFISWVGPRGIVAAGIASLFGSKLLLKGEPGAEYITPLVFMIVLGTVLLNATTARIFAKAIGVFLKKSDGILIVGASEVSRLIAKYLQKNDRHVILLDSNSTNVRMAKELDLDAIEANIYSDDVTDNVELSHVGYLMALTGSNDINNYALNRFRKQFGENGAFRLISKREMDDPNSIPKEGLFSTTDDYINLVEVARKFPTIQEVPVNSQEEFTSTLALLLKEKEMIPLFLKQKDGYIDIISSFVEETELSSFEGSKVVYLGKPIINELEGITKDSL
ncbi:sodium/hydrogen exchanger [Dokdonia pacifica]|uniref:Sodium/proton antiporter, CPA1 family n=1 Tax=Dokdonia pacifica TaxID=1627892 RepID=A0A238WCJ6_9FLAO|nr:sodium:proton antiporter [Dokdonia pacifica]GGG13142.1 sodium/hydrogen exchanger [Dokdonia pacifica]SNR44091.1 sodium/proton antiporter, CPA1 family [Dokdonia pacifica]